MDYAPAQNINYLNYLQLAYGWIYQTKIAFVISG